MLWEVSPLLSVVALFLFGCSFAAFHWYFKSWKGGCRSDDPKDLGDIIYVPIGFIFLLLSTICFCYLLFNALGGYPVSPFTLQENAIYEVVDSARGNGDSYGVLVRMPDTDCLRLLRYEKKVTPGAYKVIHTRNYNGTRAELQPFKLLAN